MLERYIGFARSQPIWLVGIVMLGINLLLAALSHHWLEPWGSRWVVAHWGKKQQS